MVSITDIFIFLVPITFGVILILAFRKPVQKYFLNRLSRIEKKMAMIRAIDQQSTDISGTDTKFFGKSIEFFEKNTNLLVIIASICTIISLAPLFLGFLLGENWFSNILGISLGFDALMLIIAATFFGATFSVLLLVLYLTSYWNATFNDPNIPYPEKISTLIINFIGGISILCLNIFLVFVWFTKFDLIIFHFAFPMFMTIISILFLVAAIAILGHLYKNAPDRIGKTIIFIFTIIFIITLIFTLVPVANYFGVYISERTKYYTPKTINTSIICDFPDKTENFPIILSISPNLSELKSTTSISDFDVYYAQCRWSTNYGFFFTTHYNNSVIKKRGQEFIISQCSDFHEKIYWTYDNIDYLNEKPPVYIGLSVDDPNKRKESHLSNATRVFTWDKNSLESVGDGMWISRIPNL